jgi:V/A-type H+-transporting ATPase subunit C
LAKTKIHDTDLLTLSAIIRFRETKMLTADRIERMLEAPRFEDAAKLLEECGYPDLSGYDVFGIEDALSRRRVEIYDELSKTEAARPIVNLFRLKFDYHNVKTLVKSMGANEDATRILSESGIVGATELTDAFISGERGDLPEQLRTAISEGVGTLSRTGNPQLSDITADKLYYDELSSTAKATKNATVTGYVKLLIDGANLRTFVRSARTGKPREFLAGALFDGGNASKKEILELEYAGEGLLTVFRAPQLYEAVKLAPQALGGGTQTAFEREIDNAPTRYTASVKLAPFGAAVVLRYLLSLDWEMTAVRMILSGHISGIAAETIRERLRETYV